ncbi:TadE-like protein [Nesterenkonia sandarakina]|uniref:TadE-like protein n=2 Tax=Nesterenkonia sandarakina TaxID=272918 RepID=A0A2T0YHI5_9MICC|nr:TadE-like protein [Nesterenkonia sandarakina]
MVSALLVLLSFAILQLTLMVHVRNTLIDAASTGARFGVLEDRTASDGVQRTQDLIESSISARYAQGVGYEYVPEPEGQTLRITVQAQVPVLGLFPGVGSLEVTGSAYDFD